MGDFGNKKAGVTELTNKTFPMPVTCGSCGFELPKDAEKNSGYFVNFLTCRDKNRNNKTITGVPSTFMEIGKDGKIIGSSTGGYQLRENYTHVGWTVRCVECSSKKTRLDDLSRKTNNLIPTGKHRSLSLEESLNSLRNHQSMRTNSKPS